MRPFISFYYRLLSVILLPVSLLMIAVLVLFKESISEDWHIVIMALISMDLGYLTAIILYSRARQGEKVSPPKPKEDLETEIQKASKEDVSKNKNANQQVSTSKKTSTDEINVEKKLNVNILDLHTAFIGSEDRLKDELKSNSKRATINLSIGSAIGIIGIFILVWFVFDLFNGNVNADKTQMLHSIETFGARLCIVFLIELFSYFFLKLYKDCIERTRYYQNELTNIESKKIAILASAILGDTQHIKLIIESMLCVERNFIIPKECTTLELEKIRSNSKSELNIIDAISKLGLKLSPGRDDA